MLVCPSCGNEEFERRETQYIERCVTVNEYGIEDAYGTNVLGSETEDELRCTNCFELSYFEDLIPEDEYRGD